jgi:hypothetical protein
MATFVPSKKVLWPSGQAELCKSFHSGSNPLGTSTSLHAFTLQSAGCNWNVVIHKLYQTSLPSTSISFTQTIFTKS